MTAPASTPESVEGTPGPGFIFSISPASDDLPEQFGRYRLRKKLGQGGMGAVYLAHDTALDRVVAIKIPFLNGPDPDTIRARFLEEARAAAGLHHPNICPVHDLGEAEGFPFLTMEFIDGEPLTHRLVQGSSLEIVEAVRIVRRAALALQYAHERGVIHRDLKPGNIMLRESGEPVIMDFGLARRSSPAALHLTREGQRVGTPAYMAPEQACGDQALVGPSSDIYCLCVVLYELLTGTVPFQGDFQSLLSQITTAAPERPSSRRPDVPPRLDAVCLRGLEKSPKDRWPSMKALADALEDCATMPSAPAGVPSILLRITGTPIAYRPRPDQEVIAVGRQRRKLGDPPERGNDFVLRVADDDRLSTRISRRHFEIRRSGRDYFVVDHSKAGLMLNGQSVAREKPTRLSGGDTLLVAGVVTLEVLIEQAGSSQNLALAPVASARDATQGGARVEFEVSVGDMVTVE